MFSFRYTIGHAKPREIAHNPTCNYFIKKEAVSEIKFHDTLWPGEDVEFDIRLLKAGHKILYSPDVVVWHHRRSRPMAFLKQMFNYGKTRAQVTRMHPSSFDVRYFVFVFAFVFVASLFAACLALPCAFHSISLFPCRLPLCFSFFRTPIDKMIR